MFGELVFNGFNAKKLKPMLLVKPNFGELFREN
jgi:hypothetical protein